MKAELSLKANGDYPLIKIIDIRNNNIGTTKLWHAFNLNEANECLLEQLNEEEMIFINSERTNKKIQ